jgi:hypothetical protein
MQALTAYWREKYAVASRWTKAVSTLAGSFLGTSFQATISVEQCRVVVEGPDPGILLRRQSIAYVTRKLDEYLRPEMSPVAARSKSGATARGPVASPTTRSSSAAAAWRPFPRSEPW